MEYQITIPITIKFYEKYMKHFPYLNVIKKSKRKDNEFYIIDARIQMSYFKLNYKDADMYYSCIHVCDDSNRRFFHGKDFEALDKLCREGIKYEEEDKEEDEEEVSELEIEYQISFPITIKFLRNI